MKLLKRRLNASGRPDDVQGEQQAKVLRERLQGGSNLNKKLLKKLRRKYAARADGADAPPPVQYFAGLAQHDIAAAVWPGRR